MVESDLPTVVDRSESPIPLAHPILLELLRVKDYSRYQLGCLSIASDDTRFKRKIEKIPWSSLGHLVVQNYLHLQMAWRACQFPRTDLLIILEFFPMHMWLAAPLFKLSGRRLAFIMHGCQQAAATSFAHRVGLWYFKLFGFEAIQLEVSDEILPENCRIDSRRRLVIPLPIYPLEEPRLKPKERLPKEARIRIGIVGYPRKGKPSYAVIEKLSRLIQTHLPECELVVGAPAWLEDESLSALGIPVHDTTDGREYFSLLRSLDIFVSHYEQDAYYYRASGIISDAVSCGCHVVCPDYPVFSHQVTMPTRVGTTYANFENIGEAIEEAISFVRAEGQDNQWNYREARSAPAIAELFDRYLEQSADHISR
jgi:hypothetical protein